MSYYALDHEALAAALQIVQIGFYITASVVAVLTYRSAKKGLLNTVRTEYQKRVMDRLAYLANELWTEYDRNSPNWWGNFDLGAPLIDEVREIYERQPDAFANLRDFEGGIPVTTTQLRLIDLQTEIETDPFLPAAIRDEAVRFLEHRQTAMIEVNTQVLAEYTRYLTEKRPPLDRVKEDHNWVHNRVLKGLKARGADIGQVEETVAKLRLAIQQYLESFDPGR